ncbi:MAG: TraY domain-containing protein [Candidatus Gastranaerophilales bacterium]|nr:TraY domain-containing protein [Candidatus Gastranaerophilales bacterium]
MASEQFSLRLSKDTKSRLEQLAQATGRTKAFLANDAIKKYLDMEAWQISAIQTGLNDIDNNNTVDYDKIKKKWEIE